MRNKIIALAVITCLGLLLYGSCKRNDDATKINPLASAGKLANWTSGSTIVNGTYGITSVSSNYVMSFVPNGTNPQLMVQSTYNLLNNDQRYTVTSLGSGLYKLINVATGKALAAYNTATGWQLQLMPYSSTDTKQQWKITYIAASGSTSAGYQLVNEANTALCATSASTSNYAQILNNTILTSSANTQRWNFGQVAYQDSTVTSFFQRTSGSEAFDGNFSVPLVNGQVVWFTNDVYYNQLSGSLLTSCSFPYHNSVMIQPSAQNWTASSTTNWTASGDPNVPTGSPQLFWDLDTARYIWPGAGIQIGNYVYAYCNEVQNVSGGFEVTGAYLANLNLTTHQVNYQSLPALDSINFGIGMIKNANYVYVYGYKNAALGANVYVARFDTTATATWKFYAGGSTWSTSASSAVSIGQAASAGADVQQIDGKYVMVSTGFNTNTGCDTVTQIFANLSTSLTGPFSALKVIYNIPDRLSGYTPYFYTPIIEPQATITGSNEFLFTYCINSYQKCVATCNSNKLDPNVYRPRGVRVPYSVVSTSL